MQKKASTQGSITMPSINAVPENIVIQLLPVTLIGTGCNSISPMTRSRSQPVVAMDRTLQRARFRHVHAQRQHARQIEQKKQAERQHQRVHEQGVEQEIDVKWSVNFALPNTRPNVRLQTAILRVTPATPFVAPHTAVK